MSTTLLPYDVVTDDDGNPIEANTLPWLMKRRTGLGASNAGAILELSPWESPRDVQLDKLAESVTDEQNEAMEFGHLMEPVAMELFRRRHSDPDSTRHRYLGKIEKSPGLIRSRAYPWLLASLDSLIVDDKQAVPGQVKNVSAYKKSDWDAADGGVPDLYRVQVLQEMIVHGSDHGWLLPIFGGNHMPEPILIEWDQTFVDYYLETSEAWWQRHIIAREPAPLTMADDLDTYYSGVRGAQVTLPQHLVERARVHKELGQQIKVLTAERDAAKFDVQAWAAEHGDGTELVDDDGALVATWRPHAAPQQLFDKAQLRADHPDLYAAYTREGKTVRPFLSK